MKMNNEIKIGLMVSVTLVLLAALTIKTGNFNLSTKGYMIKAEFKDVDGVSLNSPVMFNGFEVGTVETIEIKEGEEEVKMEVHLWVSNKVKLRAGSQAYVKNLGFMGEKYIGLTSGDKGGVYLAPGSVIKGQESPDFGKILTDGQEIAGRIKSISENIDELLEANGDPLTETLTNLNLTMKELASITSNINARLDTNEKKIDDTVTNLHGLSVNLEELSYDLKLNPWKLMYRGKSKKEPAQREARQERVDP